MEQEKNIVTCLMKDDISNFLLAYRKLVNLDYDIIGIQTAYDRRNQQFVVTQDLTKHFDKLACIGPVPIYEEYVTMANFPIDSDLNIYTDNVIHIDIMEHLKTNHLDDIYPKHPTVYHPKLQVNKIEFDTVARTISSDTLNLVINIFDPQYDKDFNFIFDVIFYINALQKEFDMPVTVYNAGLIHPHFVDRLYRAVEAELEFLNNVTLVNISRKTLSEHISYMLHSDLVLSGSYGLGFLAYMIRAASCIIFPYNMIQYIGKTIDPTRNTESWYLETTDEDLISNLDNIKNITRRTYDRNRNSNI